MRRLQRRSAVGRSLPRGQPTTRRRRVRRSTKGRRPARPARPVPAAGICPNRAAGHRCLPRRIAKYSRIAFKQAPSRCRQRQTGVTDLEHQDHGNRLRHQHRQESDLDRRLHVLPRIEARRQYLHRDQAQAAPRCSPSSAARVCQTSLTVKRPYWYSVDDQRHRQHGQRERGGKRKQKAKPQPPIEQFAILRVVGVVMVLGTGSAAERSRVRRRAVRWGIPSGDRRT